jgi:hypothetical protein
LTEIKVRESKKRDGLFDKDHEERRMRMTPEAESIHARLLGYTVEDHRADHGWLAKAAAKLILEQAEEIERLKPAFAARTEEWQPTPDGGEDRARERTSWKPPAISPLF